MAPKLLTYLAVVMATVAITVGSTAKFAPHLFFKVPNIGFILYAMTGGTPIPPYIVQDPFSEKNRGWLKKDDVIVSVGAKSGTTWMLYCSHQIRVKGNDEKYPYTDVSLSTPWPGFIQTPGATWESQMEQMNTTILPDGTRLKDYWDHDDYPFRVFKSHDRAEVYGDLIGGEKVKFIVMARNGLDVVSSLIPFFDSHTDEFRHMWGNFPPKGSGDVRKDAETWMTSVLPGGMLSNLYFDFVNSWWSVRNEKNVLLLHYSDAKKDLPGTVKKIAKFFGMKLNAKEEKDVIEKCSFPHMKKHTHMFNYKLPLNPRFKGAIMTHGSMTRKGINGDGKVAFTNEEREKWRKAEEDMFGDDPNKLAWARSGGKFK